MLVLAVDEVDASLKAAELVRRHFPNVTIVARARDRYHAYKLHALGVDQVIRESFESALLSARLTLMQLGVPESTAIDLVRSFRDLDERLLLEQIEHRADVDMLVETNAKGRAELQSLLSEGKT